MPLNFDDLDAKRRQRNLDAQNPSILSGSYQPPQPEDLSFVQQAGDVLAAPFRGVEGAAQGIYGLADTLAFDALPNWENRVLGESRTAVGGLIEGITQFASGFVPLVGAGEWAGLLGNTLKGAKVARAVLAGAITDFSVFDGHQARLSNLVQQYPSLANPINDFLAAKPGDTQIEGRLKNALEGAGVGLLTDAAIHSLKALGAGLLEKAAGKGPKAVHAAMEAAVPASQIDEALRQAGIPPPEPVPGAIGDPSAPEAAAAVIPPPSESTPPPQAQEVGSEQHTVDLLGTVDVTPERAREMLTEARRREHGGDELLSQTLDPKVNPRNLSPRELFAQGMLKSDLNLSRYQGPDGALQWMRAVEQMLAPIPGFAAASRVSLEEQARTGTQQLLEILGETKDPQSVLVAMQRDAADIAGISRRSTSWPTALMSQGDYARRLTEKAFSVNGTDKDLVMMLQAINTYGDMHLAMRGIQGEYGRGLGANRIVHPFMPELFTRGDVEAALHESGGRKRALDIANKFRLLNDPDPVKRAAQQMAFADGLRGRRALNMGLEYWQNSLISRPTTLITTTLSNALFAYYRPLEKIAGGLLAGRGSLMAEGFAELHALTESVGEAWRSTAASLRGEGEMLDPKRSVFDAKQAPAITAANAGLSDTGLPGQAVNWLGKIVRLPGVGLHVSDQFFGNLNARAIMRSELLKDAIANPAVGRAGAAQYVTEGMDRLIYQGQAYGNAQLYHRGVEQAVKAGLKSKVAIDESARAFVEHAVNSPEHARLSAISQLAMDRAMEVTQTRPLEPGKNLEGLVYRYQEAVQNHWYLRLITPFVKSPFNILKNAGQRLDAIGAAKALVARNFPSYAKSLEGTKNRMIADILSGNPSRSAEAMGRLSLGMGTAALIITKASETTEDGLPLVTGRGPADKEQRQILEQGGWQPYSIRIGDKYVSYSRLDPFATVLGTAADMVNYVKYAPAEDQGVVEDVSYGLAVSLLDNFANKTYLSGMAGFIEAMHDPQRNFPTWARTFAASFVPGTAAAAVAVQDPYQREVRSILDAARARWPGASDTLPPLRNVLGEPVRKAQSLGDGISSVANAFVPILYREVSDDKVNTELRNLAHGFTPPKRTVGGLDLTTVTSSSGQNAFDRWLELHGEVKLGGRDLRTALRRLIDSPEYQRIPPESTEELDSPRIGQVQSVIDDYRQAAMRQLIREFPEIGAAQRAHVAQRAQLLQGRESRPSLLQALKLPGQ
jgi:hypothetical protein